MIGRNDLIELLGRYNINGSKLISNNSNVLDYGEYKEIEEIIKFLLSVGFAPNIIEKCPSIISWTSSEIIKNNYNWLIANTELNFKDISSTLYILGADLTEMKKIYYFVLEKYGIETLRNCLTILSDNYSNIVSLTKTLEETIGLNIIKEDGGTILTRTTSGELRKILTILEFKYNPNTKEYNKNLLTSTTFKRTYDEIKEILKLPYWQDKKYKYLLTTNIWNRLANEIDEIIKLPYWEDKKYKHLLTENIWSKDASQIKKILELKYVDEQGNEKLYWDDEKYKQLLKPSIWSANVNQIKDILELKYIDKDGKEKLYWDRDEYQPLLKATIFKKNANQVKEILGLKYMDEQGQEKSYRLDPKYKEILTSSIWVKEVNQIKEILNLPYWKEKKYQSLLKPTIWLRDANQIKEILELKYIDEDGTEKSYWDDEKYKPLFTSSMWQKDAAQIKEILSLPYWKNRKYKDLLTSSIYKKNAKQIIRHIEFCESDEDLKIFSNNPTLIYRISYNELIAKTNYLRTNNIPVVIGDRINSIYGMSNKNMQKKYGISKKELIRDYLSIEVSKGKK